MVGIVGDLVVAVVVVVVVVDVVVVVGGVVVVCCCRSLRGVCRLGSLCRFILGRFGWSWGWMSAILGRLEGSWGGLGVLLGVLGRPWARLMGPRQQAPKSRPAKSRFRDPFGTPKGRQDDPKTTP